MPFFLDLSPRQLAGAYNTGQSLKSKFKEGPIRPEKRSSSSVHWK